MSYNKSLHEFNTLHVDSDNIPTGDFGAPSTAPTSSKTGSVPPAVDDTTYNYVYTGKTNSIIEYKPTNPFDITSDSQIAMIRMNIPFSWFNISSKRQNNQFSYVWPSGDAMGNTGSGREYTCVIPDGHYGISDLNAFLQYCMIRNGHYLVNAQGQNVFYIEIVLNSTRLMTQINCYPLPTVAAAGTLSGTTGYSGWTYGTAHTPAPIPEASFPQGTTYANMSDTSASGNSPLNGKVPMFGMPIIGVNTWPISTILGFAATKTALTTFRSDSIAGAFFPATLGTTQSTAIGTALIEIDKEKAILIRMDRVSNPTYNDIGTVGNPGNNVIASISVPKNLAFGSSLTYNAGELIWISLNSGQGVSKLVFTITDEDGGTIMLNDPNYDFDCYIRNIRYG